MIQRLALLIGGLAAAAVLALSMAFAAGQTATTSAADTIDLSADAPLSAQAAAVPSDQSAADASALDDGSNQPKPDVVVKTVVDTVYVAPNRHNRKNDQAAPRRDRAERSDKGDSQYEDRDEHQDRDEHEDNDEQAEHEQRSEHEQQGQHEQGQSHEDDD